MYKFINILSKGLASFVFVALLVVNVKVGSGSFGVQDYSIQEATADTCQGQRDFCRWVDFPGPIIIVDNGEPIIVTP